MKTRIATLLATWFYVGRVPKASGTAGSFAALPFAYLIQSYAGNFALALAAALIFFVGWWAAHVYMHAHDRHDDPQEIVIDEVAGQWLLLACMFPTPTSYVAGFLAFRLFDIIKPWPISLADRNIKGAFGVMIDDILAAGYPVVLLVALQFAAQCVGAQTPLPQVISFLSEGACSAMSC